MKKIRVMWLLNHKTLRSFEVDMLKSVGIDEIFMPKSFPYDEGNLSANVVYDYDQSLTIPPHELDILNAQNWYESPSDEAWKIANKYFEIAFIAFFPEQISSLIRFFKGQILLRTFGLSRGLSYTALCDIYLPQQVKNKLTRIKNRFWFAAGYEHLKNEESGIFKVNDCYLPVGLKGDIEADKWRGNDKQILFVCPRINTSPYYKQVYTDFKKNFDEFPYVIGGAQPIPVDDSHVMGFVPNEQYETNMKELRVMYYHSNEPNHVHYHPFEAIKNGMPLVFMAGGLLDRLGGKNLPGRCRTIRDAKIKLKKIFNDDQDLIKSLRQSQEVLFDAVSERHCAPIWRENFQKVLDSVYYLRRCNEYLEKSQNIKKKKIAVILPVEYRGGSLRGAKLLAEAFYQGANQSGDQVEVILAHLDIPNYYTSVDFQDISPEIKIRPYDWKILDQKTAQLAMIYSGSEVCVNESSYQVPDDGMNYLGDCDLWVVVSDRILHPLLPIKPYVCMIYDYLQRYEVFLSEDMNRAFINAADCSEKVLVTTDFTKSDALHFAGLKKEKVVLCPMLIPDFSASVPTLNDFQRTYFIWTTNLAVHKNHQTVFEALNIYYHELHGELDCYVTGVETEQLLTSERPHLKHLSEMVESNHLLKSKLSFLGELPDEQYKYALARAAFLLHPAKADNGTFSVIESAHLRIPSLSSNYPAMREINDNFALNMLFMNPHDPRDIAIKLKEMESSYKTRADLLPSLSSLQSHAVENVSVQYWNAIRGLL